MQILKRIVIFLFLFSCLFFLLRFQPLFPIHLLEANLSGISWLYSAICLIFSIISAFIIQAQWSRWDRLEDAVQSEINGLRELLLFSEQLPLQVGGELKKGIHAYLTDIVHEGWKQVDRGERSESVEKALQKLQKHIFTVSTHSGELTSSVSRIFSQILQSRNERLHYSRGQLPFLLYIVISLASFLVIGLSLFIAVPTLSLDYLFTVSIALLAFLIFSVIEDLNHPYRPGTWHLTTAEYKELLKELS